MRTPPERFTPRRFGAIVLAFAMLASATARASTRDTRVSYLSGASVYVDAGRLDGLSEGDTLRIVRDGSVIAWLRVSFASSHRASCDTLRTLAAPAVGDVGRFTPVLEPRAVPVGGGAATDTARAVGSGPSSAGTRPAPGWLRGRAGLRYLDVGTGGSSAGNFHQPSLDVRLDGLNGAGGALDIALDVRGRHTTRSLADGSSQTDAYSRVYRASFTLHDPPSHRQLTLGRQSSPTLASISLFDGVLLETGTARRSVGFFSGTQPDPIRLGVSPEIFEYGLFGEIRQPPLSARRWSVAMGGVSSVRGSEPNRDFLFAQSYFFSRPFSGSWTQEVDLNRGWKLAAGERALSPTSTYASARTQLTPSLSLDAGYDNRRSVRLYRDRLTPETEFDDHYRQGAWLGGALELARRVRLSADTRFNRGTPGDRAHSWTTSLELMRIAPLHSTARVRWSQYVGNVLESRLFSATLGLDPVGPLHFELAGGRRESIDLGAGANETEHWMSADVDLSLSRKWYATGSFERDRGGVTDSRTVFGGLSWRF